MGKVLKQPIREKRLFQERAWVAMGIVIVVFLLLLARYFYLQVIQHDHYLSEADNNRIKSHRITPTRGLIFDRNGTLLAENKTAYRLQVVSEKAPDFVEKLEQLKQWVQLSEDDIHAIKETAKYNPAFKPITIKEHLSETEVAAFAVNQHQFTGFHVTPYLIRQYNHAEVMSHVIGYVSKINADEYAQKDQTRYAADDYVGKLGLEKYHEEDLHGTPGLLRIETNARGRQLHQQVAVAPSHGKTLNLTIDLRLQQASYDAFGEETGAAIAVNPNNGEILAMVSKPGYDINQFIAGISHNNYQALLQSPDKPLFNRSIKGGYEPGSTIKPYMALAGLHHKLITPQTTMFSSGSYQLPNQERKYHDWKRGGHGRVDLTDSLAESVNVYFYDLAVKLGIDRIESFLKPFQFGQLTGLDIAGEKRGILPSRQWKKANRNMIWFPGETVITGIGQGYFVITPVQMAQALTILASKGKINPIHLVKRELNTAYLPMQLSDAHWRAVHEGMSAVINAPNGTARALASDKYLFAGKSGTSQVFGKSEEDIYKKNEELPKHLRNHALFIAFAPVEQPEIAVVVVAEHGASGTKAAAPIAKKIMDAYMQIHHPEWWEDKDA